MALIKCSECGNEISSEAENCPNCGNPIAERKKENNNQDYNYNYNYNFGNQDYEITKNIEDVRRIGTAIKIFLFVIAGIVILGDLFILAELFDSYEEEAFIYLIFFGISIASIFFAAFCVDTIFKWKSNMLKTNYEILRKIKR